jgi:glutamate/aspartate transport system permease protein
VRQISEYTFRTFEIFTIATIVYALITLTVTFSMRWLENKTRIPGYVGGGGK